MKQILISLIFRTEKEGKIGLCQCPGKNLAKGRDGKSHSRSIKDDLQNFRQRGVSVIVCLLNDSELRSIGVDPFKYQQAACKVGILLIQYPILEMAAPSSRDSFELFVVEPILHYLEEGRSIVVHCRGGIGRAGLVAACLLKNFGFSNPQRAIAFVRQKRDKRAVESRTQEDFIKNYYK